MATLLACAPGARAGEPIDLALVLVSDVSRSIDDGKFDLEKRGYATALTDHQVVAAIRAGPVGKIAVSYVEFASNLEVRTVVDWTVISDAPSAAEFATRLKDATRSFWGRTAISAGMDRAMQMLTELGLEPSRKVIDICGDGTNNSGREVSEARDDALAARITVNGLAIINEHPVSWAYAHVQPPGGLAQYYRENVIGGPGSFVLEVYDFQTFGEAMTRKLISEIAGVSPLTRFVGP